MMTTEAFVASSENCRHSSSLAAEEPQQALSGAIGDMLTHYQEQAKDGSFSTTDSMPQADKQGVYRIQNEEQHK